MGIAASLMSPILAGSTLNPVLNWRMSVQFTAIYAVVGYFIS